LFEGSFGIVSNGPGGHVCGLLDPVFLKRQVGNAQICDKFAENGFVSTLVFFFDLAIASHLSLWLSSVIRQKLFAALPAILSLSFPSFIASVSRLQ